ncbi:hypothetical protein AX16_008975 [Volvariella volvacea WC 439]|nr:hypothetical protein AX16_008975 [Volvariella volvacea WC 439]
MVTNDLRTQRVDPILYEIGLLPGTSESRFHFSDPETRSYYYDYRRYPSGSQARHIRHLLMESRTRSEECLSQCHNLQNLALCGDLSSNLLSKILLAIQSPRRTVAPGGLLRLSVYLKRFLTEGRANFNHTILKDITHLNVLGEPVEWQEGNNYACMKNLRYLSFMVRTPELPQIVSNCLDECDNLELIFVYAIFSPEADSFTKRLEEIRKETGRNKGATHLKDDRVVVFLLQDVFSDIDNWIGNWIRGATGGYDLWTKAARIVENRRRKGTV